MVGGDEDRKALAIFSLLDTDGDGFLDGEEVRACVAVFAGGVYGNGSGSGGAEIEYGATNTAAVFR